MSTSDSERETAPQTVKRKAVSSAAQAVQNKSKRRKESSTRPVNESRIATPDSSRGNDPAPNYNHISVEDIVSGGDMIVNVGKRGVTTRYRVSSQFLWVTSPTFAAWFGPNSKFSIPTGSITLDDDPKALKLVFSILCYKHEKLPETLDLDSLVEICRIADKYHLERPLRLVVIPWIKELASHIKSYEKAEFRDHRWLFVSWVFRCEDVFIESTRRLSTASAEYLDSMPDVPEGLTDKLRGLRDYRINKIRGSIIEQQVSRCRPRADFKTCKVEPQASQCHFLQRGFLENTMELYSYDDDNKWDEDVGVLIKEFRSIENVIFVQELEVSGQRYISSGATTRVYTHQRLHGKCGWLGVCQRLSHSVLYEDLHLRLSDFPSRGKIESFCKILESFCMPSTRIASP